MMESYRLTGLMVLVTVWVEFVIAACVVFLDPNNNTFPYTTIVLTWPGVLEEIHRIWALIIFLVFLANLLVLIFDRVRSRIAPVPLLPLSILATVLLFLQASFGAITIWNYDYPPFVVMHEGNAGLLLFVSSILAAYALYHPQNAPRAISSQSKT
jgi:heme A synthase